MGGFTQAVEHMVCDFLASPSPLLTSVVPGMMYDTRDQSRGRFILLT